MAQVNKTQLEIPSKAELAADARALVRRALKASLATIAGGSYPYASLITVATKASGTPIFLISGLAQHTRNLTQNPRASILFDGTGAARDPLQAARVTLFGKAEKIRDETVRRRFLARHPEAAFYADFPDFSFWRLAVEGAHHIGGFGRIVDLAPAELLVATERAEDLLAAEPGIIEHMNADHADAVRLYATRLAGAPEGLWRMSGIDPEGCDLLCEGDARRISFKAPIATPGEARKELGRLANEARKPD
jgi:heme oxygenase (biliverdin-IX-beta and delta-forming)